MPEVLNLYIPLLIADCSRGTVLCCLQLLTASSAYVEALGALDWEVLEFALLTVHSPIAYI